MSLKGGLNPELTGRGLRHAPNIVCLATVDSIPVSFTLKL